MATQIFEIYSDLSGLNSSVFTISGHLGQYLLMLHYRTNVKSYKDRNVYENKRLLQGEGLSGS